MFQITSRDQSRSIHTSVRSLYYVHRDTFYKQVIHTGNIFARGSIRLQLTSFIIIFVSHLAAPFFLRCCPLGVRRDHGRPGPRTLRKRLESPRKAGWGMVTPVAKRKSSPSHHRGAPEANRSQYFWPNLNNLGGSFGGNRSQYFWPNPDNWGAHVGDIGPSILDLTPRPP